MLSSLFLIFNLRLITRYTLSLLSYTITPLISIACAEMLIQKNYIRRVFPILDQDRGIPADTRLNYSVPYLRLFNFFRVEDFVICTPLLNCVFCNHRKVIFSDELIDSCRFLCLKLCSDSEVFLEETFQLTDDSLFLGCPVISTTTES